MSDYHILSGDKNGNRFTVVMHLPLPDTTNAVGFSYRTAMVEWTASPIERRPVPRRPQW